MGQIELTKDETEVLEIYRMAKKGQHADVEISIKGGELAKVFITNKKIYDRKGNLRETI